MEEKKKKQIMDNLKGDIPDDVLNALEDILNDENVEDCDIHVIKPTGSKSIFEKANTKSERLRAKRELRDNLIGKKKKLLDEVSSKIKDSYDGMTDEEVFDDIQRHQGQMIAIAERAPMFAINAIMTKDDKLCLATTNIPTREHLAECIEVLYAIVTDKNNGMERYEL